MLDPNKHRVVLINILQSIYADPSLRTILGFKGGTAAMLFYDLPRMSVDLDFDLLDETKKDVVMARMPPILQHYGELRDGAEKYFTLFFLLSYEKGLHTIKLDISKRPGNLKYVIKNYLGVAVLVMRQDDMLACKLAALITRKLFAMRDVFDIWYFLKNNWPLNGRVLQEKTGFSLDHGLAKAIKLVNGLSPNELLRGLGELIDEKQKSWVRSHLIEETLFQLRLYQDIQKRAKKSQVKNQV